MKAHEGLMYMDFDPRYIESHGLPRSDHISVFLPFSVLELPNLAIHSELKSQTDSLVFVMTSDALSSSGSKTSYLRSEQAKNGAMVWPAVVANAICSCKVGFVGPR